MQISYAGPDLSTPQKRLVSSIEWLTRGRGICEAQQRFDEHGADETFFRRAAAAFMLKPRTWFAPRAYIPKSGPLLVVANHPFGVADGLAISALLEAVRPDVRIIVWDAIGLPPTSQHFLPLDLSENKGSRAKRQNVAIRRKASEYLGNGGCIILFPSGSAEITNHPLAKPKEASWTPLACRLAFKSDATVLPVFVHGHNSRLFHAASHLGILARRSLFLLETRRMIGARIACRIGQPILPPELAKLQSAESGCNKQLAGKLRDITLRLSRLPAPPQYQWASGLSGNDPIQGMASRSAPSFSTGIRSSLVIPMCSTVALATKMDE